MQQKTKKTRCEFANPKLATGHPPAADGDEDPAKHHHWEFKSGVRRGENACYLLNKRPVSLNEGNYRVSFEPVDAKVPIPALHEQPKHAAN